MRLLHLEHRRFPRFEVTGTGQILDEPIEVDLLNVGLAGLAVRASSPLEVGTTYCLRLGGSAAAVDIDAELRWCHPTSSSSLQPGETANACEGGLAFADVAESVEQILGFIYGHEILHYQRGGSFGRFALKYDRPLRLRARHPFRVRCLSLSGALLETGRRFEPDSRVALTMSLGSGEVAASARVVNVTEASSDDAQARFEIGVEFQDLEVDEIRTLRGFLAGMEG
jgi:hypothetical protein